MKYACSLLVAGMLLHGNHAHGQGMVKLSGKIQGATADSITVSYNGSRLVYQPEVYTAHLKRDGSFSLSFPLHNEGYTEAQIKYGNRQMDMVLDAGYALTLTAEGKRFDTTLHYEGKGKEVENFVAHHAIEQERMNSFATRVKPLMALDSVKFPVSLRLEEQKEIDYAAKHGQNLPASFTRYWSAYYRYYMYFYMLQYPTIHEMVKQKTQKIKAVTHENYKAMEDVPVAFNDSFLDVTPYLLYTNIILQSRFNAVGFTYDPGDSVKQRLIEDSLQQLAYNIMPAKTGAYFSAQDLYARIRSQPLEKTKRELAAYAAHWPESEYLPLLNNQAEIIERLAPGMPAPDFTITTMEGKKMHLSDLKGHVVYLSFWNEQCKQCIGEMVHSKKMKDLLAGKAVDFVYVSIDADTTWHSAIRRYKISGLFTGTKGGWYAPEVTAYGVQGLPTHFLIDTDGKLSMQRPPSPEQETELILAIGKLMK